MEQVQIAAGKYLVALPDTNVYSNGEIALLTDEQFREIRPELFPGTIIDLGFVANPGDGGGGGGTVTETTYVFTQAIPSATWVINHNLGREPSVTVVDSALSEVKGDIHYNNSNTITCTFGAAFSGTAYLN